MGLFGCVFVFCVCLFACFVVWLFGRLLDCLYVCVLVCRVCVFVVCVFCLCVSLFHCFVVSLLVVPPKKVCVIVWLLVCAGLLVWCAYVVLRWFVSLFCFLGGLVRVSVVGACVLLFFVVFLCSLGVDCVASWLFVFVCLLECAIARLLV